MFCPIEPGLADNSIWQTMADEPSGVIDGLFIPGDGCTDWIGIAVARIGRTILSRQMFGLQVLDRPRIDFAIDVVLDTMQ